MKSLWSIVLALLWLAPLSSAIAQPNYLERLARKVEPDLTGQTARLPHYVEAYQNAFGNDPRLFCFEVEASASVKGDVRLTGFVEISEMRLGLIKYLELLGFLVVDEIGELPSKDLGNQNLGLVKSMHSLSYDKPSGSRSVVTDCLLGDRLFLLRETEGHLLVHSREGYLGYVSSDDVLRVDAKQFEAYANAPSVTVKKDYQASDELVIPAGAQLKLLKTESERILAELPTGESVELPPAICEVDSTSTKDTEEIIENGRKFLGTKYVWGGKSSEGIDCSGLVQVAFYSKGISLPRDSNQQFLLGTLTATRWHRQGMRRGDTLYFLGPHGRIRHTAIYLGDDRYLQAEMPEVDIRSFNPEHDDYDPRRVPSFAFAKRLLD